MLFEQFYVIFANKELCLQFITRNLARILHAVLAALPKYVTEVLRFPRQVHLNAVKKPLSMDPYPGIRRPFYIIGLVLVAVGFG